MIPCPDCTDGLIRRFDPAAPRSPAGWYVCPTCDGAQRIADRRVSPETFYPASLLLGFALGLVVGYATRVVVR